MVCRWHKLIHGVCTKCVVHVQWVTTVLFICMICQQTSTTTIGFAIFLLQHKIYRKSKAAVRNLCIMRFMTCPENAIQSGKEPGTVRGTESGTIPSPVLSVNFMFAYDVIPLRLKQYNCRLYRAQSTGIPYSRAQRVESLLLQQSTFVPQHSVDVVNYFHSVWGSAALLNAHRKNSRAQAEPWCSAQPGTIRPCFNGWRPCRPGDNRSSLIAE